ncbi:MAG: hypothetical protein ABIL66_10935 [candidate division WOR-3 bacterium]
MGNNFFALLPIIILLVFLIPIIGIFLIILIIGLKRTKASEWHGVVVDKIYATKEKERKGSLIMGKRKFSHFYTLVVKTDDGVTKNIAVTKEMYDSCAIGDKLVKRKGALNPVKEL